MKLTQYDFSNSQYIRETSIKTQIYLHHTAGNSDPFGVYDYWSTNSERVGTCVVIGGRNTKKSSWEEGEVAQGFSSKYWAFHLGLKESTFHNFGLKYKSLDRISIGIELCNWGQLQYKNGKYYTYTNKIISPDEVVELETPFKGFKFFHSYSDKQIESLKELLQIWSEKYNIPLDYNEDIWDVTERALKGEPGIYTHNSVRYDKTDISPQPKIIEMLKSLKE